MCMCKCGCKVERWFGESSYCNDCANGNCGHTARRQLLSRGMTDRDRAVLSDMVNEAVDWYDYPRDWCLEDPARFLMALRRERIREAANDPFDRTGKVRAVNYLIFIHTGDEDYM